MAEDVYQKAYEYLASGGEEIFPETHRIVVITAAGEQTFRAGEIAKTQLVLKGFSVPVDDLLA